MKEIITLDADEPVESATNYTGLVVAVLALVAAIGFILYTNSKKDEVKESNEDQLPTYEL